MASWGLAFQYGKKAYEDMWKEQEENERLAATRRPFDMTIQEQEEALEDTANTNREVRAGNRVITKYKKQIERGGEEGAKAYAMALSEMGIPAVYLGNMKVGTIGADGQVDPRTVLDMGGKGWNGRSMMAEVYKYVPSAENAYNEYNAAVARNQDKQLQMDLATIQMNAQLRAAQMRAAASAAGMRGIASALMEKQYATNWKDVAPFLRDRSVKAAFGPDVTEIIGPDGLPVFYRNENGKQVVFTPSREQLGDLENIYNKGIVDTHNLMSSSGIPTQPGIAALASRLADYGASLRGKREAASAWSAAIPRFVNQTVVGLKDAASSDDVVFARPWVDAPTIYSFNAPSSWGLYGIME